MIAKIGDGLPRVIRVVGLPVVVMILTSNRSIVLPPGKIGRGNLVTPAGRQLTFQFQVAHLEGIYLQGKLALRAPLLWLTAILTYASSECEGLSMAAYLVAV